MVMRATVTGEQRAVKVLEAFDRDAYKAAVKALREAGNIVRNEAREFTPIAPPLSQWGSSKVVRVDAKGWKSTRRYDGLEIRRKIGVRIVQDRSNKGGAITVRVQSMSAAGGIFALSGSAKKRYDSGESYRGRSFVINLNKAAGDRTWPRALLKAVVRKGPEARPLVEAELLRAARRADLILNRGA